VSADIALNLLAAFKSLESQVRPLLGPAPNAGWALARAQAGLPDPAVTRNVEYQEQRTSVLNRDAGPGYANTALDVAKILELFHASPLIQAGEVVGIAQADWDWLRWSLAAHGIDMALPNDANAPQTAQDWLQIVQYAAQAAPLDLALRAWHLNRNDGNDLQEATQDELQFHLRRAGYSREGDQQLLLYPWAHWNTRDAQLLNWMGLASEVDRISLFRAAGHSHERDERWALWLNTELPGTERLIQWAQAQIFDDEFAARYGLDQRFNESAYAQWWARRQGAGVMPGALPDQPAGETDWLKLAFRSESQMPSLGEAITMQRRLRPGNGAEGTSVVPGVPVWDESNTQDVLRHEGYSDAVSERILSLVHEPLSARVINRVLVQSIKHPEIEPLTKALYDSDDDWVENAYLDQGHREPVAKLLAEAMKLSAEETANAEMYETQKQQRKSRREQAKKRYLLGVITDEQYALESQDEFYTTAMVHEDLEQMTRDWHIGILETQIKEIRAAYLDGKISVDAAQAQLVGGGINQNRMILYVQEWTWEKNEKRRVLETGEILRMVKMGLMDGGSALVRLVNLGWNAPEAVLELSIVERDLQEAAAKALEASTRKAEAAQEKTAREQMAERKRQQAETVKAAKEKRKTAFELAAAPLEQEALAKTYAARSSADLEAYAKASAKSNQNKMDEVVAKAAAEYATWLRDQIKLRGTSVEVESEVGPIDTERIEVPAPSKEDSGATGEPTQQPDAPAKIDGGASPPAAS
jgi:hypothetical protein